MKAITMHQPWASLVALGVKTIETRSWAPPKALIGERLLIHAGAKAVIRGATGKVGDYHTHQFSFDPEHPWIHRISGPAPRPRWPLPLGAIVASCVLADAVPMVEWSYRRWAEGAPPVPRLLVDPASDRLGIERLIGGVTGELLGYLHTVEVEGQRPYGDFAPGRWAWLLEDVKPTTERCPACWGRGHGLRPSAPGQPVLAQAIACAVCHAGGACPPILAKGHQRIWEWEP